MAKRLQTVWLLRFASIMTSGAVFNPQTHHIFSLVLVFTIKKYRSYSVLVTSWHLWWKLFQCRKDGLCLRYPQHPPTDAPKSSSYALPSYCKWTTRYVTMVKCEFEVRQLQATDNHYLHVVYEETNLFSLSDTAALAQEQFYFGPLHGFSGHHIALWELGMVVHGLHS